MTKKFVIEEYWYKEEQDLIKEDKKRKERWIKAEKMVKEEIKGKENDFDFIMKLYEKYESTDDLRMEYLADILVELEEK